MVHLAISLLLTHILVKLTYADIPFHRQKKWSKLFKLRDVLDFRSRQSDTAVDFSSTGAVTY
jgi:hypothetical protein